MVDPATMATAAKAGSDAFETIGRYAVEKERGKSNERIARREAKEKKRKTLAELLDAAMGREFESGKDRREGQRGITASQMKALSEMAANVRSALAR